MSRFLKRIQNKNGSVLILAIFFVIALMTVIPGAMLQMGRNSREVQRYVDHVPLSLVSDSIGERAIKLISDFVIQNSRFPSAAGNGKITETVGGKTFEQFLLDWYADSPSGFKSRRVTDAPSLGAIQVDRVELKEVDFQGDALRRQYVVTVELKQTASGYPMRLEHEFVINNARLFDFSVFYNENIEIGAGPDFELQGPIFSNKDVYMMNNYDRNGNGNTLTLRRSDDFDDPISGTPEKYVVHSAGHTYFYFNRALARNYLLPLYRSALPPDLQNPPQDMEVLSVPVSGASLQVPKFYFFSDQALWNRDAANIKDPDNIIKIQDAGGTYPLLTHPSGAVNAIDYGLDYGENVPGLYRFYMFPAQYGTPGYDYNLSLSPAMNPANVPALDPAWVPANPVSSSPEPNPLWTSLTASVLSTAKDNVPRKDIPIGDPNHPSKAHVLIEPLTGIFPPGNQGIRPVVPYTNNVPMPSDSPEVAIAKLESLAQKEGLDLYAKVTGFTTIKVSDDLKKLVDARAVRTTNAISVLFPRIYDYRFGLSATVLEIDIAKLITFLDSDPRKLLEKPEGVLIYVHTYPMNETGYGNVKKARFVKLINGHRLPEHGLTIATPGRLFIQGDYNTFDYTKGRDCDTSEWDVSGQCTVPPAAIISDSAVILSKQWQDSWNGATSIATRTVTEDVMVNTAFATGYLISQLSERYKNTALSSVNGSFDCFNNITSGECQFNPSADYSEKPGGDPRYNFEFYGNLSSGFYTTYYNFSTHQSSKTPGPGYVLLGDYPQNSPSCEQDQGSVPSNCLYYKDVQGDYFLNENALLIQAARDKAQADGPPLPMAPIPIFVTTKSFEDFQRTGNFNDLVPTPGFRGVAFSVLYGIHGIFGEQTIETGLCNNPAAPQITCGGGPDHCGQGQTCVPPSGENSNWSCSGCVSAPYYTRTDQLLGQTPYANYYSVYYPLYDTHYSGGLENLINLQENWSTRTLRVLGTFSAPWLATELNKSNQPVYWNEAAYASPNRKFDFNEDLRNHPPPGAPFVFEVRRKSWRLKGN